MDAMTPLAMDSVRFSYGAELVLDGVLAAGRRRVRAWPFSVPTGRARPRSLGWRWRSAIRAPAAS